MGTIDLCSLYQKMSKLVKRGKIGMNNVEIGRRIQEIRKERNMTREDLAEKAEISSKFVYEVESGKKGLSAESIAKITQVLSTSSDYLLTGAGEKYLKEFRNLDPREKKQLERVVRVVREFLKVK